MPIDLSKLGTKNLIDTALDPKTIFSALPKTPGRHSYLRNVQAEVLDGWFTRRTEKDLVVKMNTGAGKTITGLLILKSCLNEKIGPAAYFAPDDFLSKQVLMEATQLNIPATGDIADPAFLAGKRIFIGNIHKLINGRSQFMPPKSIGLGSLVIDDAHSCLSVAERQFTLTLPASHLAFTELLNLFRGDLEHQASDSVLDIEAGDPSKMVAVPFWAWRDRSRDVVRILHSHRNTKEIEWQWPLVKDSLTECVCTFSGREVTVSSRCLNIDLISGFARAKRRIYMTATLADDSSLVTHFNATAESIRKPVTPKSAADLGDRMILAPQRLNGTISDNDVRDFVQWMGETWNVVVIVPSAKRAKFWEGVAAQVLTAANLDAGVAKLRNTLVGITVLVNKYDGVDLPHDACRVLVIDGVPEVDRPLDRIDASILHGSEAILSRHVQRIEQGMGRGIRANDDFCLVLLLGAKLIHRLSLPSGRQKLSPATLAQIELAEQIAEQLHGKEMGELYSDAMTLCLAQDPSWVQASRGALASVAYGQPDANNAGMDLAQQQRKAFSAAILGNYSAAAAEIQAAVTNASDVIVKGWLKQQLADYLHATDPVQAQQTQLSAQSLNRQVLKPVAGIAYAKLAGSTSTQAKNIGATLGAKYSNTGEMLLGFKAILDELLFQDDSYRRFEAALKELGENLGFPSQRPEVEFGVGPDNLWAVGPQDFVMIECKNEATSEVISKEYIDKSSGRRNWFASTYGLGAKAVSVLIHPSKVVSKSATPEPGFRVLTRTKLDELKNACLQLSVSIAQAGHFAAFAEIDKTLRALHLSGTQIISRYTEAFVVESSKTKKN